MKIPRFTSGPWCYTLEQWATRMAFSDLFFGVFMAAIFFYLSTIYGDVASLSEDLDEAGVQVVHGVFIAFGVIFLIPAVFSIVLIIGLFTDKKIYLLIWCYYVIVCCVLFIIFLFTSSIAAFIYVNVGSGFLLLAFTAIIAGHQIYSALVVHSIYLNLKEAEETHTTYPQT